MGFYKGKKVFIAGGAGMIGQALIRALVPLGAEITATEYKSRKIDAAYREKIKRIIHYDLNSIDGTLPDFNVYEGQEIVFWAAAKVGGAKMIRENPMSLVHYNLELAARNIEAATAAGVERFCYVSSSYVYAEHSVSFESDTERGFDVPLQHYGLGWIKRFIEKLCKAHQLTSKTRFALVRPTAIYGPHDNFDLETCHVIPALIRKVAEGQSPLEVWGDGSEQRQFTYVDDLVQAMLLVTERYAKAEPVNVATDTVSRVIDVAQTLLAINARPENDIKFLGEKPKVVQRRVVNTDRCKSFFGYECKTSLKDGLKRTFDWYKTQQTQ